MAAPTTALPAPPDVPIPEQSSGAVTEQQPVSGQAPVTTDFDSAFDSALSQAFAPKEPGAFDQAFDVASQKLLAKGAEPENIAGTLEPEKVPWWEQGLEALLPPLGGIQDVRRFAQSALGMSTLEHAAETLCGIVTGAELGVGRFLDPSAKFADQSSAQLLDGVGKSQEELGRLQADLGDNPNQFRYDLAAPRIASLQNDIAAMRQQLAAKSGMPLTPTPVQAFGQALISDAPSEQITGLPPPNPLFEPSQAGTVARLAGGILPYVALSPLGPVAETAAFAGGQYAGAEEEGKAAGATIAQRNQAGDMAALLAPAQMLAFRTVLSPFLEGSIGRTVGEVFKNTVRNLGIGAGMGGAQTVWNNAAAVLSGLDPNRKLTDGLAQSVGEQAATMGVLGLATEAPSFALRSLSTPRIDIYRPQAGAVSAAAEEPSPVGASLASPALAGTVAAAAPAESGEASGQIPREELFRRLEEGLGAQEPGAGAARMDLGGGPVYSQNGPIAAPQVRSYLADLVDQFGERLNPLLADERSLPLRYRSPLEQAGTSPESFQSFFDQDSRDFVVNPKNFDTLRELNDAIIRNAIPNTFSDKAKIVPIDSFSQVSDTPEVARLLERNPSADSNTDGLYDPTSGHVFLNVPKHLDSAEPIPEAIRTVLHEVAGHQGTRTLVGTDQGYDSFLERVYNGMRDGGMGDQIAAQFGTNMEGLATRYGFGTQNPDGTVTISPRGRLRLADELLARYAERFDPHQLEALPGVLSRAIDFVRDGLGRDQGLSFSDYDAFRTLRAAWRAAEPPREAAAQNALLAKQITQTNEPTNLRSLRAVSAETDGLRRSALAAAPERQGLSPTSGVASTDPEIRASSERLGLIPKPAGFEYSPERLESRAPYRISGTPGDEHDVRFARDSRYLLNITRPDGASGPYGPAPSFPPTGEDGYGGASATADQYLHRLALSNEYLGSQHDLEGFLHDPESGLWRILSSEPRIQAEFRAATTGEIASFMAARGFAPIDERTYYNPENRILALQAEPGNVVIEGVNGNVHALNVAPFEVGGELARHLDQVVSDPTRLSGLSDPQGLAAQLLAHGAGLAPTPEAASALSRQFALDSAELARLRSKAQTETLSPQEQQRMDAIEFGPLLKRDIDTELSPDSPDKPPIEVLKRAIEDMYRSRTSEMGERVHAARTATDPNEPDPVRAFNAAEDQLQYEKGSREIWRGVVQNVFDHYGGDLTKLTQDLVDDRFREEGLREYEAATYGALKKEIATRRAEAIAQNDPLYVQELDARRYLLDDWANERRTSWGKEGAAWQDTLISGDGIIDSARAQYTKALTDRIRSDPAFGEAVKEARRIAQSIPARAERDPDVERALSLVQRAEDVQARATAKRPGDWALAMARSLTSALEPARVRPGVEEMLRRFRTEISAQMREGQIKMDPETMARVRASKTIGDALRAWPYLERVQELVRTEGMKRFANDPLILERFRNLGAVTEVPFSQTHLARFAREQGVDIRHLFRQHREQIGKVSERLCDFLVRQSSLRPDQAELIQKTVGEFIDRAVKVRRELEFKRIIDAANNGKPKEAGRGTTMGRLLDLVNMGAFSDEQVANALAAVYGYRGYDPALDRELVQIGDNLEKMRQAGRDGFQTEAVRMALNRTIADYAQVRATEYWANIFRGNILATAPGHAIGFINETLSGIGNVFYRLGAQHHLDPRTVGFAFEQLARGFAQALPEARYILGTGQNLARFTPAEKLRADNELRTRAPHYFESYPTYRALKGSLLSPLAPIGQYLIDKPYLYSSRAINALHNTIYGAFGRATEALAAVEHARLNQGLSQEQALDWARQSVNGNKGTIEEASQRAEAEGLAGTQKALRVQELLEQKLPEPVLEAADYWGTRANAYQDPHGVLGAVSSALSDVSRKHPVLTPIVPIIRLPFNLLNTALDLTPWGFARYLGAENYLTRGGELQMTPQRIEELKGHLLAKAITGTGLLAAGFAASCFRLPNGQFLLTIHGAGPQDKDQKYQLMDRGWQPYSFQFGKTYLPFETVPAWLGLGMLGNWQDAQRYQNMPPGEQAIEYMLGRSMSIFLDRSTLRGISDFLDTLKQAGEDPNRQSTISRYLASQGKSFIPLAGMNLWKQAYQQFLDDKLYRAKGYGAIARDIPFAASAVGLKPIMNALGEPVQLSPLTHRFWSTRPDDKVWEFLDSHQIWLSKPGNYHLLGKPMDEEQKYDFTALRGQHLRQMLGAQLDTLGAISDPDVLVDRVKKIERTASRTAISDLIRGVKPQFSGQANQ